jgi:hypothetical protein
MLKFSNTFENTIVPLTNSVYFNGSKYFEKSKDLK